MEFQAEKEGRSHRQRQTDRSGCVDPSPIGGLFAPFSGRKR